MKKAEAEEIFEYLYINNERDIDMYNWKLHSYLVASVAEKLGKELNLDTEKCYVMGLLHDAGRCKTANIKHLTEGYKILTEKFNIDDEELKRICITHSFLLKDGANLGAELCLFDKNEKEIIEKSVKIEYSDYDKVIQISDLLANHEIVNLYDRIFNVLCKYDTKSVKTYLSAIDNLKKDFDKRIGKNVYDIIGLKQSIFKEVDYKHKYKDTEFGKKVEEVFEKYTKSEAENLPDNRLDLYISHSRNVAFAAVTLGKLAGLSPDLCYGMGFLHDIGKFRARGIRHSILGYQMLKENGFDEKIARIPITHLYIMQDGADLQTQFKEYLKGEQEFVDSYLSKIEYDEYDKLIQIADLIAPPNKLMTIEERMFDIFIRYEKDNIQAYCKKIREIKKYFEEKCNLKSIYDPFIKN